MTRKKRAKKKVAKKKTTRRKNPCGTKKKAKRKRNPRKKSAQSHLWVVFKCHGRSVKFLHLGSDVKVHWTTDKGHAVLFKTQQGASNAAKALANKRGYAKYKIGITSYRTTLPQIRGACNPKK